MKKVEVAKAEPLRVPAVLLEPWIRPKFRAARVLSLIRVSILEASSRTFSSRTRAWTLLSLDGRCSGAIPSSKLSASIVSGLRFWKKIVAMSKGYWVVVGSRSTAIRNLL